jgi:hypothetical protein
MSLISELEGENYMDDISFNLNKAHSMGVNIFFIKIDLHYGNCF